MKIFWRWLINSLLLLLIAYLIKSINISGFYIALITAAILGLINALIRPLLILITLPINIVTLGLFTLVINALLFWLVASFVAGFSVTGFMAAFWGALLLSIGSWLTSRFIAPPKNYSKNLST